MANAERAQPTPSPGAGQMGTPPSVHVQYVVVDGPEGDELLRRQLNVIRDVLSSLRIRSKPLADPETARSDSEATVGARHSMGPCRQTIAGGGVARLVISVAIAMRPRLSGGVGGASGFGRAAGQVDRHSGALAPRCVLAFTLRP